MAEEGPQDWSERTISTERKRAEQAAHDARAQLLEAKEQEEKNNEFVAAAFEAVIAANEERIRELQDRMAELDRLSLKALTDAQEELDELRRNANRARDGRNVYRAADGNIYDEDGKLVAHEAIDWSTWREDGPTWDTYSGARSGYERAREFRRDVLETGERLEDDDLSDEELDELEDDLADLEAKAPDNKAAAYWRETPGSGPRQDVQIQTSRTTSAAKILDDDGEQRPSIADPFYAAANGVATPDGRDPPDRVPVVPFTPV